MEGTTELNLRIKGLTFPVSVIVASTLADPLILGRPFLSDNDVIFDYKNGIVNIDNLVELPMSQPDHKLRSVRISKPLCIPPFAEAIIPVKVHKQFVNRTVVLDPVPSQQFEKYAIASTAVHPTSVDTVIRCLNFRDTPLILYKNEVVAHVTDIHSLADISVHRLSSEIPDMTSSSSSPKHHSNHKPTKTELQQFLQKHKVNIGSAATADDKHKLASLLYEFSDIFATDVSHLSAWKGPPFDIRTKSDKGSYR